MSLDDDASNNGNEPPVSQPKSILLHRPPPEAGEQLSKADETIELLVDAAGKVHSTNIVNGADQKLVDATAVPLLCLNGTPGGMNTRRRLHSQVDCRTARFGGSISDSRFKRKVCSMSALASIRPRRPRTGGQPGLLSNANRAQCAEFPCGSTRHRPYTSRRRVPHILRVRAVLPAPRQPINNHYAGCRHKSLPFRMAPVFP